MGVLSYQKLYRSVESRTSPNQTVTHPLLLAVINVDQGIVKVRHQLLHDPKLRYSNAFPQVYDLVYSLQYQRMYFRVFPGTIRVNGATRRIACTTPTTTRETSNPNLENHAM